MLSIKDRILLALAWGKDILGNRGKGGERTGLSYEQLFSFMPFKYKKHNFSASLSYALKTQEIKKKVKNKKAYYFLTSKGERKLTLDFPLVSFQEKNWDLKWRVLIYDIPESSKRIRDLLRKKIKALGFGKLQDSVYLSPFRIEREMVLFLEKYDLAERVLFLISDNIIAGGDKFLAEEVWKLSKINKLYEELSFLIKQIKSKQSEEIRYLKTKFLEIVSQDPFLPKDLLPIPWYGGEVAFELQRYF